MPRRCWRLVFFFLFFVFGGDGLSVKDPGRAFVVWTERRQEHHHECALRMEVVSEAFLNQFMDEPLLLFFGGHVTRSFLELRQFLLDSSCARSFCFF